jgi:hypothetical protein
MTSAGTHYAELCLYRVWQELTVCGFAVDEPVTHGTCQCFFGGLGSAHVEMDLLRCGALVWEYIPIPQGSITPQRAARIMLALLAPGPAPASLPPAPDPGLPLKDAAAQMLAARGMMARPAAIRYPYPDPGQAPEVHTEVVVRNLARRDRGYARITDEGTIRWQCQFAVPGNPASGLAPPEVAQAIAAALAEHRATERGGTPDSDTGQGATADRT